MTEQPPPAAEARFSATWLKQRERYDAAARARDLARIFCDAVSARTAGIPRMIDLATGRGANAAYLSAFLEQEAEWLLVDNDPDLLAAAASRLTTVPVERCLADLAHDLDRIDFNWCDGVTASALLDLVSAEWLEGLARRCAAVSVPILFSLTYDGGMEWQPRDEFDGTMGSLFDRHQGHDKGFGPALGPAAAAQGEQIFRDCGFDVAVRGSPWQISSDDPAMLDALIDGVASACLEAAPASGPDIESWRERRRRQRGAGALALQVGHVDILALP